jgi:quercetin 2,3-dioxygenase
MKSARTIRTVIRNRPAREGAGVHLKSGFGNYRVPLYDPFLMLDDFRSDNPGHYRAGFPWHPHRGIETVTYVLNGDVEQGESIGNMGN